LLSNVRGLVCRVWGLLCGVWDLGFMVGVLGKEFGRHPTCPLGVNSEPQTKTQDPEHKTQN